MLLLRDLVHDNSIKEIVTIKMCTMADTQRQDSSSDEETIRNSLWKVGNLAWGHLHPYPFWPCKVTKDPESGDFQKMKYTGNSKNLMIHVHYFNDNGQHSWLKANDMFPFNGLDYFEKKAEQMKKTLHKRDKLYQAFTIKATTKKKWLKAIEQATEENQEEENSQDSKVKPTLGTITELPAKKVRQVRKRSKELEEEKIPSFKKGVRPTKSNKRIKNNNAQEEKCSIPAAPTEVQPCTREPQEEGPAFERYYQHSFPKVKEQHPSVEPEHIRIYLKEIWDEMTFAEKKLYYLEE